MELVGFRKGFGGSEPGHFLQVDQQALPCTGAARGIGLAEGNRAGRANTMGDLRAEKLSG